MKRVIKFSQALSFLQEDFQLKDQGAGIYTGILPGNKMEIFQKWNDVTKMKKVVARDFKLETRKDINFPNVILLKDFSKFKETLADSTVKIGNKDVTFAGVDNLDKFKIEDNIVIPTPPPTPGQIKTEYFVLYKAENASENVNYEQILSNPKIEKILFAKLSFSEVKDAEKQLTKVS